MSVYENLKALNITLPAVAKPVAAYVMYVKSGNLVYLSGHIAKKDGKPLVAQFGRNISFEEGKQAARRTARPGPKARKLRPDNATRARSPRHRPWLVSPATAA